MTQPLYQLRPNKAVDRLIFMEALRRLDRVKPLDRYTYYSLGGPYLEDFRVLYEINPHIGMTSIDLDAEVIKRQKFHQPCSQIRLKRTDLRAFITNFQAKDRLGIFWLDYTRLTLADLEDFGALLAKVTPGSVVKITLRARSADYLDAPQAQLKPGAMSLKAKFKEEFATLLPDPTADPPLNKTAFVALVQQMVRIAAQRGLQGPLTYQPLCSFYYSDGTPMLTVTGIVCVRSERASIRETFGDWLFASLNWAAPKRIAVPVLTTKERLHLQDLLPARNDAGRALRRALGYRIDEDIAESREMFKQYALFHRYAPYYMRGIP